MAALFFISGQLAPAVFAPVYAVLTTTLVRTIAVSIFVFPLANWAMGYAYQHFGAALVAPLTVVVMVFVNVVMAMWVLSAKPSLWIIPAMALTAAGALWVSLLLQAQKGS